MSIQHIEKFMIPFTGNTDSLTFHIRITKKCNADCSYCSSFEPNAKDLMELEDLEKSMKFIKNFIIEKGLGGSRKMVTVQYIGGELLTVPFDYLQSFTNIVESYLSPLFENFRHGGQSNLIGSKLKINNLMNLFDGNLGTSIDNFTQQRTVAKSSDRYQKIFFTNLTHIKKNYGKIVPGIIVIDDKMRPYVHQEIANANLKKTHLNLRPIFNGGVKVDNIESQTLTEVYSQVFDNWFLKQNIMIEPHFSLLQKRLTKFTNKRNNLSSLSGCAFQHNCSVSSLNLEPDGTLYVCQDMADSKHYPIGNALKGIIDEDIFSLLSSRTAKLNNDCLSCDYFNECQGGCMNEAIEQTQDVFGKTQYCSTWKFLFKKIDDSIVQHDIQDIQKWINKISSY